MSSGSHGLQYCGSSLSSTSNGSGSRISSGHFSNHQYSASDGNVSNYSSPSDSFHAQQWNTLARGINLGEYVSATISEPRSESLELPLSKEGCLVEEPNYSGESSSSYSDAGDSEQSCILYIPSSNRNYSGLYPFVSKPVYPITYRGQASDRDVCSNVKYCSSSLISAEGSNSSRWPNSGVRHADKKSFVDFNEAGSMQGFADNGSSFHIPQFRWNSASSSNFGWHHESPDQAGNTDEDNPKLANTLYDDLKCALCERWLFQKSPWDSHRIVRSGDMPVAGVLSCSHVYHAECLEQATPKSQKHDPPCPLCAGVFRHSSVSNSKEFPSVNEREFMSTPANELPMFKITADGGSSSGIQNRVLEHDGAGRRWGMQMPLQNSKSFLSKTCLRKHFLFKGKSVKELPAIELGQKGTGCPGQVYPDRFRVGCSRRGQYLRNRRDTPFLKYYH